MQRIAILEASHWHVPLYLDGLDAADVTVAAVSDRSQTAGCAVANRFDATFYSDVQDLLDQELIDFAFVFGRHVEMAELAGLLIEARIPFSLEKPCGMDVGEVSGICAAAQKAGLYNAVPYIYRVSELCRIIEDLEGGLPSDFTHLSFRFIAGEPHRYKRWNCDWMLDPSQSGGGALINLGGHFIDMFLRFTGRKIIAVSAVMSAATHGTEIEDYAAITLQADEGVTGVVEVGYTYPDKAPEQRDFSFSARSKSHYLLTSDEGLLIRPTDPQTGATRCLPFESETDLYYPVYARQVLNEWRTSDRQSARLCDALDVMKVIEASYRSARKGGHLITVE